ncbi:hypothetical protein WK99_32900 [Burkholderia ubonensis]|nr:hypothetical protein WK99_32900 [Burkholderia ubonensis]
MPDYTSVSGNLHFIGTQFLMRMRIERSIFKSVYDKHLTDLTVVRISYVSIRLFSIFQARMT